MDTVRNNQWTREENDSRWIPHHQLQQRDVIVVLWNVGVGLPSSQALHPIQRGMNQYCPHIPSFPCSTC